jgi:APA family basic amino acid/polyamine antiporter
LEPAGTVRLVTAFTAGCVIVSNMIGTGIFGTTGFMAADLGSPALILALWVVGGVYALLGAVCYSELGAALPEAGGEYVYLREAFGPVMGFLSGWTSLAIGFSAAIASNAHLFASHVLQLFPGLQAAGGSGAGRIVFDPRVIGLVMIWGLTAVHVAGVGAGGRMQRFLTVLKVGGMVALVVGGAIWGEGSWSRLTGAGGALPGMGTLAVSFYFVTFTYSGWNAAGYIAGEIISPGKSIPRAALGATAVVTLLYLAVNSIYLYALPVSELAAAPVETPAYKAAGAMFGAGSARWITALLAVSIMGAASAMIWAGPRVYWAMAQDGVLPRFFAGQSKRCAAPVRAILLQSVWVSVLVVAGGFEQLVVFAGFAITLFTGVAVGAVMVLRHRRPALARPYRVKLYPLVPLAYLAISGVVVWSSLQTTRYEPIWALATIAAGLPFYLFFRRQNR